MLSNVSILNFKKAVYLVENAYYEGNINEREFYDILSEYATICKN